MNAKLKIRLDSIEQAHRVLEALPEHRPEELTKTQAIQRLIEPIRATQSKGYSLAASADAGGKKNKAKRPPRAQKKVVPDATTTSHGDAPEKHSPRKLKDAVVEAGRHVDLDWESPSDRASTSIANARPSGFAVREDTKDI